MQRYFTCGALVVAAAIAYGTMAPVRLPYALFYKLAPWLGHPNLHTYTLIEHLLVFALFGALLAFAYPDRILIACCVVLFGAPLLEYLQTLTADRHGTILDACEKVIGGLLGVLAAHAATWLCRRILHRSR